MEIKDLLLKDESKTLEFKENSSSLSGIIKSVIAFANTSGGTIVIGIQDKTKKIVGIKNVLQEEERLINAIADSVSPQLVPNVEIQTYRKKELILIKVPHIAAPFFLKSSGIEKGTYVRFGSTNRVADEEMLRTLQSFTKNIYYDEKPDVYGKNNQLDWEFIKKKFSQVGKNITENSSQNLGLLANFADSIYPSNGAVILFGLNRLREFPDAVIRCVKFIGTEKLEVFDHLQIESYPILAIDEAIHFIEKNIFTAAKIGRMYREDIPQYPKVAIREAVTNAVLHADYGRGGSSITISIFDDRIEIINPGGLIFGLTLENAIAGSSSIRNRVIARVFRELKIIEQWGSGLKRIIDACKKAGLKDPQFEDMTTSFKVTLFSNQIKEVEIEPKEQKVITFLKKNKKVSTKEAAAIWDIDPRNARNRLKKLVDAGMIKKVGTSSKDPKGAYVLLKS